MFIILATFVSVNAHVLLQSVHRRSIPVPTLDDKHHLRYSLAISESFYYILDTTNHLLFRYPAYLTRLVIHQNHHYYLVSSGGFREGSLEPPTGTKSFQFHGRTEEKSGKM